jgi:hypothetical protein
MSLFAMMENGMSTNTGSVIRSKGLKVTNHFYTL